VQKKTLETHTIATLKVERQKFKTEYEKLKMDVAVQDRAIKQAQNFTSKKDEEHKNQAKEIST
jgi:hypothetical protein